MIKFNKSIYFFMVIAVPPIDSKPLTYKSIYKARFREAASHIAGRWHARKTMRWSELFYIINLLATWVNDMQEKDNTVKLQDLKRF
jgi:hypothetical protein